MPNPAEPDWLHGHPHEPNPAPPSADATLFVYTGALPPQAVTVEMLHRLPSVSVAGCYIVSTGHGVTGPFTFTGVRLVDLLAHLLGKDAAWQHADVVSADGFGTRIYTHEVATQTERPIILAHSVDGAPLTRAQGLVRLIVPSESDDALRQVKWVAEIRVTAPMQPWKTGTRTVRYQPDSGKYLTVESHRVELPDGRIIDEWPWLTTPDYVNVVAVTDDGRFLCFRQTKYAVDGLSLAVVGGYLEPDEDPLAAAQRELLEETGYASDDWSPLGRYVVDGNRGCGHANLFLARNARWVQPIHADDLEEQQLLLLTRVEVEQGLRTGDFKVLGWTTVVALALLELTRLERMP